MTITPLDGSHAASLLHLSTISEWDYNLKYWQAILSSGRVFGAMDGTGKLLGTGCYFMFPDKTAFIGAVIVRPNLKGKGIGTQLMHALHNQISGSNLPSRLIATVEGQPLYEKLGYVEETKCFKMTREASNPNTELSQIEGVSFKALVPERVEDIIKFDEACYGSNRGHVLTSLLSSGSKGMVAVFGEHEEIVGYALQYDRGETVCIGPLMAVSDEIALALCQMMTYGHQRQFRIDTLSAQAELRDILIRTGFEVVDTPPFMVRGSAAPYTETPANKAIISQAMG